VILELVARHAVDTATNSRITKKSGEIILIVDSDRREDAA